MFEIIYKILGVMKPPNWNCAICHTKVVGSYMVVGGEKKFVYECSVCDHKKIFDAASIIEKRIKRTKKLLWLYGVLFLLVALLFILVLYY